MDGVVNETDQHEDHQGVQAELEHEFPEVLAKEVHVKDLHLSVRGSGDVTHALHLEHGGFEVVVFQFGPKQ